LAERLPVIAPRASTDGANPDASIAVFADREDAQQRLVGIRGGEALEPLAVEAENAL
jgi:hypothetical protein